MYLEVGTDSSYLVHWRQLRQINNSKLDTKMWLKNKLRKVYGDILARLNRNEYAHSEWEFV